MSKAPIFAKKSIRIKGTRHAALDKARRRMTLISGVFILTYILIGARVFDLSIIQGRLQQNDGNEKFVSAKTSDHFRGNIVDRNGVILATSLETASLYADPSLISDPAKTAKELSVMFSDLVYGDALQKLQKKGRFVWIKRSLTPAQQYQVLELGHPGLDFKTERSRIYPQGAMASHIVGYTDTDGNGIAGIERSFDKFLQQGGEALPLTLDIRVQHILRRALENAVDTYTAKAGAGVVVDIASGEILAAVSLPDFDPHNRSKASAKSFFNNLTLGVYELGSTFKIFSTAALLETQNVKMGHKFDARKPLKRGRHTISDYHAEKRKLTVPEVFMFSSNIGAALMGEMVGTESLKNFYEDLGLMEPLKLEIEEIGTPLVPKTWRDINTLTASYGHGIAVSPLQMVMAASSIISGGLWVPPTLISGGNNKAKESQNSADIRIVSPQTAHRMRQLLRLVVTDGTGKNAAVPGYSVGGKTGTAEKIGKKGYDRKRLISSFLGFFPMEEPRYAVFVMVDEPQGTKASFGYATGGWVAAPAVGNIIAAMGPLLGIKPQNIEPEHDMAASLKRHVSFEGDQNASH